MLWKNLENKEKLKQCQRAGTRLQRRQKQISRRDETNGKLDELLL